MPDWGRREDVRAVAGFVPDSVVMFSRLLRDPNLPRRHKLLLAALLPYPCGSPAPPDKAEAGIYHLFTNST